MLAACRCLGVFKESETLILECQLPFMFHHMATYWWYSEFLCCYFSDKGDESCYYGPKTAKCNGISRDEAHYMNLRCFIRNNVGICLACSIWNSFLIQCQVDLFYKIVSELSFADKINYFYPFLIIQGLKLLAGEDTWRGYLL